MMPTHGIIEGPKIGPQLTLLKLVINPQDPQMLLLIHHLLTSKLKLVRKPQMLHISLHISHHHHKLNCKHIVMHHVMIWHISLHISHHHHKLNCKHIVMHHVMKAILLHITGQHHLFTTKCLAIMDNGYPNDERQPWLCLFLCRSSY